MGIIGRIGKELATTAGMDSRQIVAAIIKSISISVITNRTIDIGRTLYTEHRARKETEAMLKARTDQVAKFYEARLKDDEVVEPELV